MPKAATKEQAPEGLKKLKRSDVEAMTGSEREKALEQLQRDAAAGQQAAGDAGTAGSTGPQPRELAPDTSGEESDADKVYNEDTGQYDAKKTDRSYSLSSEHEDNSRTSEDNRSVGLETDGRNVKASQEGLLQNDDGEDIIGSLSVGKDGVDVEGLEMGGGWKLDVKGGPDEQKIGFKAPAELKWPPNPDPTKAGGFDQELLAVPIVLAPGLQLVISASVEGGVELGGLGGHLLHRTTKEGDDPHQQISHWEITGTGEIKADIGAKIEMKVAAGVPKLAEANAGLRATAGAEAKLGANLTGALDITQSVPVGKEKPKTYGKEGEFTLQLDGGGSVAATFGAFIGFEVLTMKGDLYTIEFVKVPIADLLVGGKAGVFWDGDRTKLDFKPAYGKYGTQFDWMLGNYFKAKRLDAAADAATSTKAERVNLKALQKMADATGADGVAKLSVKELLAQDGFDETLVVDATVKKLTVRDRQLTELITATEQDLAKLEERITTTLIPENQKVQEKRWALTKAIRGDIPALGDANRQLATLKKSLSKYRSEKDGLAPKVKAARASFKEGLEGKDVDALLVALKAKKQETRRENYALYLKEFSGEEQKYRDRTSAIDAEIVKLEARRTDLEDRLGSFAEGAGAAEVAAHRAKEAELKQVQDAKADAVSATTARLADLTDRRVTQEEAQKKADAGKGFFDKAFSGQSPELASTKQEIAKLQKDQKAQRSAYDAAAKAYASHKAANPVTALTRQKWGVEGDLLAKRVGRSRIEEKWLARQKDLRRLMLGEYVNERTEEEQVAKMAKYKKQYGSEGDTAESGVQDKYAADKAADEKKAAQEREQAEAERKKKEAAAA